QHSPIVARDFCIGFEQAVFEFNVVDFFGNVFDYRCHSFTGYFFASPMSAVGVCICCSTFPGPRYMCTPQGRQGSKLRTARMMSMPLNLSWPFSSKMGVFCTASS